MPNHTPEYTDNNNNTDDLDINNNFSIDPLIDNSDDDTSSILSIEENLLNSIELLFNNLKYFCEKNYLPFLNKNNSSSIFKSKYFKYYT